MLQESNADKSLQAAISFLSNPNIAKHSNEEKRRFLRSKGFSDDDIIRAFENTSHDFILETKREETKFRSKQQRQWSINSLFDNLASLVAAGGVIYAAYVLLERYLRYFKPKDDKSIEFSSDESSINEEQLNQKNTLNKSTEIICKLQNRMTDISNTVQSMNENIHKLDVIPNKINEMRSEINEIRTLLLNKNQFPKAPEIFPIWQKPVESAKTTIETQTCLSPLFKNGSNLPINVDVDDKERTISEIKTNSNSDDCPNDS